MPVTTTYIDNGDGTSTIRIDATGNSDKVNNLATEASEYFYNKNSKLWLYDGEDVIPWVDLTNKQKLDVLGKETKIHLMNGAHSTYYSSAVQDTVDNLESPEDRYESF